MPNCRACKKPIIFIKSTKGNLIPCDPDLITVENIPGKYIDLNDSNKLKESVLKVVHPDGRAGKLSDLKTGYISHFATCPEANKFRRKDK